MFLIPWIKIGTAGTAEAEEDIGLAACARRLPSTLRSPNGWSRQVLSLAQRQSGQPTTGSMDRRL